MPLAHDAKGREHFHADPLHGALNRLQETQGICAITQAYFFSAQEYRTIANAHDLKRLLEDRYQRDQSPNVLASLHLCHTCRLPKGSVF